MYNEIVRSAVLGVRQLGGFVLSPSYTLHEFLSSHMNLLSLNFLYELRVLHGFQGGSSD